MALQTHTSAAAVENAHTHTYIHAYTPVNMLALTSVYNEINTTCALHVHRTLALYFLTTHRHTHIHTLWCVCVLAAAQAR